MVVIGTMGPLELGAFVLLLFAAILDFKKITPLGINPLVVETAALILLFLSWGRLGIDFVVLLLLGLGTLLVAALSSLARIRRREPQSLVSDYKHAGMFLSMLVAYLLGAWLI